RSGLAEVNAALDSAISSSQSVSIEAGRALRLGKEPTTPAWHWALTSSGPEAMNMGEPKTGRRSWESRSEREFTVPPWVDECMPRHFTRSYDEREIGHSRPKTTMAQTPKRGLRHGSGRGRGQESEKFVSRFSTKAAMPSDWSFVASVEWKRRRS